MHASRATRRSHASAHTTRAHSHAACCAGAPLKLRIHASSVLARTQPRLVLFLRAQQNEQGWYEMQGVTAVEPDWLPAIAPAVYTRR